MTCSRAPTADAVAVAVDDLWCRFSDKRRAGLTAAGLNRLLSSLTVRSNHVGGGGGGVPPASPSVDLRAKFFLALGLTDTTTTTITATPTTATSSLAVGYERFATVLTAVLRSSARAAPSSQPRAPVLATLRAPAVAVTPLCSESSGSSSSTGSSWCMGGAAADAEGRGSPSLEAASSPSDCPSLEASVELVEVELCIDPEPPEATSIAAAVPSVATSGGEPCPPALPPVSLFAAAAVPCVEPSSRVDANDGSGQSSNTGSVGSGDACHAKTAAPPRPAALLPPAATATTASFAAKRAEKRRHDPMAECTFHPVISPARHRRHTSNSINTSHSSNSRATTTTTARPSAILYSASRGGGSSAGYSSSVGVTSPIPIALPIPISLSPAAPGRVLLVVDIDGLPGGAADSVAVRAGERPRAVAARLAARHGLPPAVARRVEGLLTLRMAELLDTDGGGGGGGGGVASS